MSTPNLNVLLSAALATYDNTQANTPLLAKLSAGNPTFGATTDLYNEFFQAAVAGSVVSLPAAICYVAWIRNRSTAAAPVTLLVTLTPPGVVVLELGAGDIFVYSAPSKVSGFTAITLTGLASICPVEIYVAG